MLTLRRAGQQGVTLLELMITVTIVGIVGAIGIPQMSQWIRNTSVTSAAEILQNGLRQAEAEAIRRNLRVEFLLTDGTPSVSTIKTLTASANGKNWAIRALDGLTPLADQNAAYVNGFLLKEVSPEISLEGPASVLFSGTGRVLDTAGAAVADHRVLPHLAKQRRQGPVRLRDARWRRQTLQPCAGVGRTLCLPAADQP